MCAGNRFARFLLFVSLGIALAGAPRPATALCPRHSAFLYADGTVLPSNARGVPWWSTDLLQSDPQVFRSGGQFLVERSDGDGWSPVPFEVVVLQDSLVRHEDERNALLLLCPREPWKAGESYRCSELRTAEGAPASSSQPRTVVTVRISSDSLAVSDPRATLTSQRGSQAVLMVATGFRPSMRINAAQTQISLKLPRETAPWLSALLVSTRVDAGYLWRPQQSPCKPVAPGTSWTGRGTELLYARCDPEPRDPAGALPPGRHLVRMIAWLPGTEVRIEARGDVVLECR